MFWEVVPVPNPKQKEKEAVSLSCWTEVRPAVGERIEPGKHYVVNEAGLQGERDFIVLPLVPGKTEILRHEWILRRAHRPYVPQPDATPMPDRAPSQDFVSVVNGLFLALALTHSADMFRGVIGNSDKDFKTTINWMLNKRDQTDIVVVSDRRSISAHRKTRKVFENQCEEEILELWDVY